MAELPDSDPVDEIFELFERYGSSAYDEAVTLTEHSVQTAACAQEAGAGDALVAAALLHDLGHLLLARARGHEDFLQTDWDHDRVAAEWLRPHFGEIVAAPVGLHVDAKRYLRAREPEYAEALSPASVASLAVQGGPFDVDEADAFEARPHAADAIALRRWDDDGKVAGRAIPDLDEFVPLLRSRVVPG